MKPRLLIFASGSAEGGGSGFEELVKASLAGTLEAEIVGVVSNHAAGGVRQRAGKHDLPFVHFPSPWSAERYQDLAAESGADFFALSGWLKLVSGLECGTQFSPQNVFNIHPGPLPEFGGPGMYGHHVHEAVVDAFRRGELEHSAVCMHFVSAEYDRGPVFFRQRVKIEPDDTPETLAQRVNAAEHRWQPEITNLVVNGGIRWDGSDPASLELPPGYAIERY